MAPSDPYDKYEEKVKLKCDQPFIVIAWTFVSVCSIIILTLGIFSEFSGPSVLYMSAVVQLVCGLAIVFINVEIITYRSRKKEHEYVVHDHDVNNMYPEEMSVPKLELKDELKGNSLL